MLCDEHNLCVDYMFCIPCEDIHNLFPCILVQNVNSLHDITSERQIWFLWLKIVCRNDSNIVLTKWFFFYDRITLDFISVMAYWLNIFYSWTLGNTFRTCGSISLFIGLNFFVWTVLWRSSSSHKRAVHGHEYRFLLSKISFLSYKGGAFV